MWIMLTKKLAVPVSPPKLSIHFATPIVLDKFLRRQFIKNNRIDGGDYIDFDSDDQVDAVDVESMEYIDEARGFTYHNTKIANETTAVQITYKGNSIKVYAHEFRVIAPASMREYVFGVNASGNASHELVPNSEADAALLRTAIDTSLESIFDAALMDGCTPEMAKAVAMGIEIEDVEIEFPAIGWYRCKLDYAQAFCYDWELTE